MGRANSFILFLESDDRIVHKRVTDREIAIYLKDGSSAELSEDSGDVWKKVLEEDFGIEVTGTLFWFNRLKAGFGGEGKGSGRLLMQELVKILAQKDITVLNHVNPYGSLSMSQLRAFYKKYGFVDIGRGGMIRYPKT